MSYNIQMTLSEHKLEYLEYIEIEKGRSHLTVRNYDHYISRFITFLKSENFADINERNMREYRLYLNRLPSNDRKNSPTLDKKTQNYHMIALRAFFKYLRKHSIDIYDPEKIELAKTPGRELDLITDKELGRLMAAPDQSTIAGLRDMAMLEMLFSTGLRVSELAALDRYMDMTSRELSVRGKGGKVRVVFLSDRAVDAVNRYIDKRVDIDEALFVDHSPRSHSRIVKGQPTRLTTRSIERVIEKYATLAGISKKCTPHVLRHSFATDLLYNGADLRTVQMMLGHASIATTQVYTNVTNKFLRDQFEKFHDKKP